MSIVTISRGSYSRGKEIAEALAEELSYECISREILMEASHQFNIPEVRLAWALHDGPSIFERFQGGREQYLNYYKSSFLSHMLKGNIVYHGLAGHFFLQDISHVLKVRINARMSDRVLEEMKRECCSASEAQEKLIKDDRERRRWSTQMHGKDCWDSRLYDMVLSVDLLPVQDVVDILAKTVLKEQFHQTESSYEKLKNRSLEAGVKAMVSSVSSMAKVRFINNSCVELSHLDGLLKSDAVFRDNFSNKVKQQLDVSKILFKEAPQPCKTHINNFFNIDVH
jgi:hypothetical protein